MTDISIPAQDDSGSFAAYIAHPAGHGPHPALILIQEIFGVNANMRAWADRFAQHGYLAIVPDLFWRQQPGVQLTDQSEAEWKRAIDLMNGFDMNKGVEDLATTLHWLRQNAECNGKVGCAGFCLGGRLAVLMAARTDINASVSYYGVFLDQLASEFAKISKPLLMHVAELDQYATPTMRAVYEPELTKLHDVEYHVYEGQQHAFARQGGEHYNAEAAELANRRTDHFLDHHLKVQG